MKLRRLLDRDETYWPAQVTSLGVIALNCVLPERLTAGPWWLLPALELLIVLVLAGRGSGPGRERAAGHRRLALGLIALLAVATLVSLGLLAHLLLGGGNAGGRSLFGAGVVIWANLVLVGALAFWEIDRGGPGGRDRPDFLFPAMTDDARAYVPEGWRPGFADYLYVALTNATAFSPTDTMPLTPRAKLAMGLQSTAALVTLGLVVARAVNILG